MTIVFIGTTGYWFIGERQYTVTDCLYMTVITISTIGFGEIIDMSGNPTGRVFTMFLALSGIGTLSYIITNITASIVEGDLSESFRRKRMEKIAGKLTSHYIVCGYGRIGRQIVNELIATKREFVIVEPGKTAIADMAEDLRSEALIEGDAAENAVLLKAGIERAKGVFCVTADDNLNLVISLTAKQLNSNARVVTRCTDMSKREKIQSIGADAVVSPNYIGGLRMVSEMIRPTVVSFLDIMLRDKDRNLRVEEVSIPASLAGKQIASLRLRKFSNVLLLAVKTAEGWVYNPHETHAVNAGDALIIMTTPEDRLKLEKDLRELP
jgi:voltage-gated potassium channel